MNWARLWGFLLTLAAGGLLQSYGASSRTFLWSAFGGLCALMIYADYRRSTAGLRRKRRAQRIQERLYEDRIDEVARRIIKEHHYTLERLAEDD